jgi:hypothetical protein
MSLPQTTIGQLREALAKLGPEHDAKTFKVWLPGSTISLVPRLLVRGETVQIEGNVDPGSALGS